MRRRWLLTAGLAAGLFGATGAYAQADRLPSWNDGPAKKAILDFVAAHHDRGRARLRAGPERIAVFDNDGTLWAEQPIYFQFAFAHRPGEGPGAAASGMEGPASPSSRCWRAT